ncbi:MAG: glycoside hydrolase family 5 protein [Oscillospiraceae bacterium]|jgi:endoglycosylceramidase|nr:glycoside hydrolase family 5 protein [Oscillospiraceae bacterium]
MDRIGVTGKAFTDPHGRTRIFNGFNFDHKAGGADTFRYALDRAFFARYAARGFNVLRLGVTWENLEPTPGEYNESYLRSMDAIFTAAAAHGVYIFLDMHQDLYSGFETRIGDGAPAWATLSDGYRQRKPFYAWGEGYFWSKAVHASFDHFWANDECCGRGLQEHFAALWGMLARRYGDQPALLGYDLLNEPFPGSSGGAMLRRLALRGVKEALTGKTFPRKAVLRDLLREKNAVALLRHMHPAFLAEAVGAAAALCRKFDQECYAPFLERVTAAIRRETQNGIIMAEQSILGNLGATQEGPAIRVDGRREPNQCYAPHAYDITVDTPMYKYADNTRVASFFDAAARRQDAQNLPVLVGEWGGADSHSRAWFPHAQFLLDYFDRRQWGQTYWTYAEGDLEAPLMEVLSRSCPQAIPGTIDYYLTDRGNRVFCLGYTHAENAAAPATIYIHKPCKAIETDGIYRLTPLEDGASLLEVQTQPGQHRVQVQF